MNKFNVFVVSLVALICFSGGAFVMENWHAERSAVNAADILELHKQILEMEERQITFMTAIEEHHVIEAVYMAELQAKLESLQNDIGGLWI